MGTILTRLHPIEEAVRARPREIEWVLFDSRRHDPRVSRLKRLCREAGVAIRYGDRSALNRLAGSTHQGALARVAIRPYLELEDVLDGASGSRFLLVLDEIQDPQNFGALLRVAEAAGAAVVVPERGGAPLSDAVATSSAGAALRVRIARAGNLPRTLELLKERGFRVVGLDPSGVAIYEVDLTGDLALVLGSEGKGLRRLVREGCDLLARLPMEGKVASLNVSAAAAAAAYEALRQRKFSSKPLA